ncbi:MAG TPA: helix-turn-helix domain-containing protein, partial [Candidatus Babeliaceae bacterium]|nr:helix-turn-helix domain-containing protein [Candidatus Babeliaceae bacterium]
YQINKIDETEYSQEVYDRLEKIKLFEKLKKEGCSTETALEAIKIPQSTVYRWKKKYKNLGLAGLENISKRPNNRRKPSWKLSDMQKILALRKQNPLYGKAKIAVILKRDHGIELSVSKVGRIISYYIKRDQIKPVHFYYKKKRVRPRKFDKHAQRWKYGMKAEKPGELFQIDHMTISIAPGQQIKHFQGICPVTKMVIEQAYYKATSDVAKQFLEYARSCLPFGLSSIQVDGGSEFMKAFEQECHDLRLPLWVLPPKSPEKNGNVERANGAAKYEFYAFYSGDFTINSIREELKKYVNKYNNRNTILKYRRPDFSHMY